MQPAVHCKKIITAFVIFVKNIPQKLRWMTLMDSPLYLTNVPSILAIKARTYLQLALQQWGVSNVYLLVLSSWKVNIAENTIALGCRYVQAKVDKS